MIMDGTIGVMADLVINSDGDGTIGVMADTVMVTVGIIHGDGTIGAMVDLGMAVLDLDMVDTVMDGTTLIITMVMVMVTVSGTETTTAIMAIPIETTPITILEEVIIIEPQPIMAT